MPAGVVALIVVLISPGVGVLAGRLAAEQCLDRSLADLENTTAAGFSSDWTAIHVDAALDCQNLTNEEVRALLRQAPEACLATERELSTPFSCSDLRDERWLFPDRAGHGSDGVVIRGSGQNSANAPYGPAIALTRGVDGAACSYAPGVRPEAVLPAALILCGGLAATVTLGIPALTILVAAIWLGIRLVARRRERSDAA